MPYSRGWRVAIYTHPFELCLAGVLVFNGLRGFGWLLSPFGSITPSLATLPTAVLAAYLTVSTLGGVGLLVSLLAFKSPAPPSPPRLAGPRIERASLFLVAAGYAVLAVLLVYVNGTAGIGNGFLCALIGVACVLRTKAIRKAATIIITRLAQGRELAKREAAE